MPYFFFLSPGFAPPFGFLPPLFEPGPLSGMSPSPRVIWTLSTLRHPAIASALRGPAGRQTLDRRNDW
jgi:hypothetical protein